VTVPPPVVAADAATEERGRHGLPGRDVRRFFWAYSVDQLGSGVGSGALPLVAILVLDVSDLQVSMLAVLAGLVSVLVTVPLGPWIEFHRKRPSMIAADLLRFVTLAAVPVSAACGVLTYAQLCLTAVAQTAGVIVSSAAATGYVKNLVPGPRRATVNSRLETTFWTSSTLGPPAGGVLVAWAGPLASITVDAISFALAAAGLRRIRHIEPEPPTRTTGRYRLAETTDGWRYITAHRQLRMLFCNAMLFGGCIMASTPLIAVLMLRDLGFTALQYGVALGVPCAAGVLGSLLAPKVIRRAGLLGTLLIGGVARCLWMGWLLLATPGTAGLLLIIAADSALLLCAGFFNPAFATYRMQVTDDRYLARVVTAWAVTNKLVQPVFIAAAGLLAATAGVRTALAVLAVVVAGSAGLLPWKQRQSPDVEVPEHHRPAITPPGPAARLE
jgi:MFS family permease